MESTDIQRYNELINKLIDTSKNTIDPHEVARVITTLYKSRDLRGLIKLRDAFIVGVTKACPAARLDTIIGAVNSNLLCASGLADLVAQCGYEASGQLLYESKFEGPIANFYQKTTRYNPKK